MENLSPRIEAHLCYDMSKRLKMYRAFSRIYCGWCSVLENNDSVDERMTIEEIDEKNKVLEVDNQETQRKVEYYRKIYDILIEYAEANENDKELFVDYNLESPSEWRFMGKLGFGGKYWHETNQVTCYPEDSTEDIEVLINTINEKLRRI